ncbi:transcriptional regulator, IclR family [Cognatiyoonia koreensis]|uniref:Transcriptional regulator, IclR family n=1 Tax=Cognatiyoonia koreensis TaxID=364200 RepID=A0A1I0PWL0_9RHOB|nr:IclR family transcriptional regulator [Cognatiyoonia koreensis]SEW18523.1 transcriptional regulator, IclR family [Cognatiyoonia koreensis]
MADGTKPDGNIPTNLRLLFVLEELAEIGVPITPTEVNAKLGLPKPTVHRLFHTLEQEGFLQRDIDGRSYSPGRRLRKLSVNVLSSLRVRTVRLTILNELAEKIGETCNIATPDRDAMVYLDRVETKWPLRIQLPVGTSVPFHCTASGKMYLSSLSPSHFERFLSSAKLEPKTSKSLTARESLHDEIIRIRESGYSTDDEEFMEGMVAVAVPIRDDMGRLLSTLSVHAPIQRITLSELKGHLPRLNVAARELSELLLQ